MGSPSKKTSKFSTLSRSAFSKILTLISKQPLLALAVIALVPFFILVAFTFKGGYNLPVKKGGKARQITVAKTPAERADKATELLQKRDTEGFIQMLEKLPDVNIVNTKGDTLLLAAATLGDLQASHKLILSGADVNKRNLFTGDTPLLRALYFAPDSDIPQLLVSFGADINAVNNYKQSPMFLALEKQRGDLVDLFLSNGVKEGLNADYLFRACAKKNSMGVVAMLKGGISPNQVDSKGNTPLIIAASQGDVESVQTLLAYQADINAANNQGNTALIYASLNNHLPGVRDLLRPQTLQAPIDVDAQNKEGQTALYWAAAKGYTDIVKRLLAADADTTLAANNKLVPYLAAKRNHKTDVLPWFEKDLTEVKNSVIEEDNAALIAQAKAEGRELSTTPTEEETPVADTDIFKAAKTGDLDLARRVIDQNKAVVFNKNKEGDTALLVAVANQQPEMIDFLLSKNSRLFDASGKGNVFHIAVQTQDIDLLKHVIQLARQEGRLAMMLEYKVNLNGQKQLTPLGLAALNCNKEMYDYLLSVGAKPGVKATSPNILGTISPVDLMAKCKAKPTQAKKLTPTTRKAVSRRR